MQKMDILIFIKQFQFNHLSSQNVDNCHKKISIHFLVEGRLVGLRVDC